MNLMSTAGASNGSAILQTACEVLVNAAKVFAAHWEGNLSEVANYLADTRTYQESVLRTTGLEPGDRAGETFRAEGLLLALAALRIELDWERNLSAAVQGLAACVADYEAQYGQVAFEDPLAG